jgi:hypothetical protein
LHTPAIVGFLDWDYCYTSVANQIPHESGLAQIPYTDKKYLPHWKSNQCCIPRIEIKASGFKPQ